MVILRYCTTQMLVSGVAITATYSNVTFTTVAQIVKLRGRVLEFQLSVIENDLPVSMYAICRANWYYLGRKGQGKV